MDKSYNVVSRDTGIFYVCLVEDDPASRQPDELELSRQREEAFIKDQIQDLTTALHDILLEKLYENDVVRIHMNYNIPYSYLHLATTMAQLYPKYQIIMIWEDSIKRFVAVSTKGSSIYQVGHYEG